MDRNPMNPIGLTGTGEQLTQRDDDIRAALQYQLSDEEKLVLRECNKESFFQRCLPLSSLFGIGTYYAVQTGYLRPSARWGAVPKIAIAVTVGYFAGKFSYQSKCAEKLMALPNSKLGDILRQRKTGGFRETIDPGFGTAMSLAPFSGMSSQDTYSDLGPRASDIDTYRPLDSYDDRSQFDAEFKFDDKLTKESQNATSYEDLRKKNRDEFEKNRGVNYSGYPEQTPPITPQPSRGNDGFYGTAWDK